MDIWGKIDKSKYRQNYIYIKIQLNSIRLMKILVNQTEYRINT